MLSEKQVLWTDNQYHHTLVLIVWINGLMKLIRNKRICKRRGGLSRPQKGVYMFKFSEHGIKDKDVFCRIYSGFVDYCKSNFTSGTFSTYCDGEPFFYEMRL